MLLVVPLIQVSVQWPHLILSHWMSSVFSVSWCVLCGLGVPRGGWDGIPVQFDVCGCNLSWLRVRTVRVGRSEVFGWLSTGAHLLWFGEVLTGICVWLIYLICWRSLKVRYRRSIWVLLLFCVSATYFLARVASFTRLAILSPLFWGRAVYVNVLSLSNVFPVTRHY